MYSHIYTLLGAQLQIRRLRTKHITPLLSTNNMYGGNVTWEEDCKKANLILVLIAERMLCRPAKHTLHWLVPLSICTS